ncbi:MAG: hypothetical protein GX786_09185, partial [Clostridiales bacterium]|nr:hypothetical protein [Clostridiales bacterium]
HKEKNYRIVPTGGVTAQAHQPPDGVGMLAVYRPLSPNVDEGDGSKEKPYDFILGMDIEKGKYYAYQEKLYIALQDAKPCNYYPYVIPAILQEVKETQSQEPEQPEEPESPVEEGTKEKPIPFEMKMNVEKDSHYSYQGKTYVALQDVPNCTWCPGQAGVHFFKEV